jgi:hypothetical protein
MIFLHLFKALQEMLSAVQMKHNVEVLIACFLCRDRMVK